MTRKKHPRSQNNSSKDQTRSQESSKSSHDIKTNKLEIVLKCDSMGTLEAINATINTSTDTRAPIEVIYSDVGSVSESDLKMAFTGSRLIAGFDVDVIPQAKKISQEQGIEIRLYNVIYHLIKDLKEIANNLAPPDEEEIITGEAKVIALFKSSRKGIILGCEVFKGILAKGNKFRVISAMGPVYKGKIETLHIEKNSVKEAKVGQQVGLKLSNFKDVKIGDMVECFKSVKPDRKKVWQPRGGVFRYAPRSN
jgi:translation initiation factor IF-2